MQIPNEIKECVVFLAYVETSNSKKLIGTGFFINVNNITYLVTAAHVVNGPRNKLPKTDTQILMRINTIENGYEYLPLSMDDFAFAPFDTDIAVVKLRSLDINKYKYKTIPYEMFVTSEILANQSIGIGDQVFIAGLFFNHFGNQRNIPLVRSGNIAAMPEEPVSGENKAKLKEVYLVELMSMGGFSGSPVFVYLNPFRLNNNALNISGESKIYFLGLLHGHWDDNKQSPQNTGITIVIPNQHILQTINYNIETITIQTPIIKLEKID